MVQGTAICLTLEIPCQLQTTWLLKIYQGSKPWIFMIFIVHLVRYMGLTKASNAYSSSSSPIAMMEIIKIVNQYDVLWYMDIIKVSAYQIMVERKRAILALWQGCESTLLFLTGEIKLFLLVLVNCSRENSIWQTNSGEWESCISLVQQRFHILNSRYKWSHSNLHTKNNSVLWKTLRRKFQLNMFCYEHFSKLM